MVSLLMPSRKVRILMQKWKMASETQITRGTSTVLFDINTSPNAVVNVRNRNRREATRLLFETTEDKKVRLLLYTEDLHDIYVHRGNLLRNFKGRQEGEDVYSFSAFAPGSDERVIKVTGSIQVVKFRTQEILSAVTYQAERPKHRHYTPNEEFDSAYGVRWGGYDQPDEDSELDTTTAIPRFRLPRAEAHHTRAQTGIFRAPAM